MGEARGPGVGVRRGRVGKERFGNAIWKSSGSVQSKGGNSRHVVRFLRSPYSAVNNFCEGAGDTIRWGGWGAYTNKQVSARTASTNVVFKRGVEIRV